MTYAHARHVLFIILAAAVLWAAAAGGATAQTATTSTSTPQQFQNAGVFGCNGYSIPPLGGTYVPVNDRAVTVNTSILVHKECVLDGLNKRIAYDATGQLTAAYTHQAATGDDGNPMWAYNIAHLEGRIADRTAFENIMKAYPNAGLCTPYRREVQVAVLVSYLRETRDPSNSFTCSLPEDGAEEICRQGEFCGYNTFFSYALNPSNTELFAFESKRQQVNEQIARELEHERRRLDWGRGFRGIEECEEVPTSLGDTRLVCRITTPGSIMSDTLSHMMLSGFRQFEQADEIGDLGNVGFARLANQAVSSLRGIVGLAESSDGNPSFLQRLNNDLAEDVRRVSSNAALGALADARTHEERYGNAFRAAQSFLEETDAFLQDAEAQCWELIEAAVDEIAVECVRTETDEETGEETCVEERDIPFTVATSTAFSEQAAEQMELEQLTGIVSENVESSDEMLETLDELIETASDSSDPQRQFAAIQTADQLRAQGRLRNVFDVIEAEENRDDVVNTIGDSRDDTLEDWTTGSGWCNVENENVVEDWLAEWRD